MLFKYPEVLWSLLLLIVPFLVHLFNLRRYRKVKFTNVAFLKEIIQQNRKSSQLKKWLVLFLRLLSLACIIIAFSQPRYTSLALSKNTDTVVYIDNSFSMQASNNGNQLLKRAINDFLMYVPEKMTFSLFTNDYKYENITKNQIHNELLDTPYSIATLDSEAILTQGTSLFDFNKNTKKTLILISDFKGFKHLPQSDNPIRIIAVPLHTSHNINTAIIKVRMNHENTNVRKLDITLQSDLKETVLPITIYNDTILVSRIQADFLNHRALVSFPIGDKSFPKGRISIKDQSMTYDNDLYFTISDADPINVMVIGPSDDRFLRKIFSSKEFTFISKSQKSINYNAMSKQDLLILNGLSNISTELEGLVRAFLEKGGHLAIIPRADISLRSYNSMLRGKANISSKVIRSLKINNISFSHPLYKGIFSKRVHNFKYPETKSFFTITSNQLSPALLFENQKPFLLSDDVIHLFASPLDTEHSNFQNSPLIALTFYSMAKHSLKHPPIYYTIGRENQFDVPITLQKDKVLKFVHGEYRFIPLQTRLSNKTRISTTNNPNFASNFDLKDGHESLMSLSYNFGREESFGIPINLDNYDVETYSSISKTFDTLENIDKEEELWKWFLMFALVFLLLEMLVLKLIR